MFPSIPSGHSLFPFGVFSLYRVPWLIFVTFEQLIAIFLTALMVGVTIALSAYYHKETHNYCKGDMALAIAGGGIVFLTNLLYLRTFVCRWGCCAPAGAIPFIATLEISEHTASFSISWAFVILGILLLGISIFSMGIKIEKVQTLR